MNRIIITYNRFEKSESIEKFIKTKFSRLLHRCHEIIRIRVELNLESGNAARKRFSTRTIIELRGPDIVAVSASDNAYASIDATLRKAERQLHYRALRARFKREQIVDRMRPSLAFSAN